MEEYFNEGTPFKSMAPESHSESIKKQGASLIINPLEKKEIEMPEWFSKQPDRIELWNYRLRLLFYDPKDVYERAGGLIDPFKRTQSKLSTAILFPKRTDGICRCGCERKTKTMWYSQWCSNFAYRVYAIICYGTAEAKTFIQTYYGGKCQNCKEHYWEDIDHIVPVKYGGGGCWLSNFLPLCKTCHKDKTKRDFNWKEYKPTTQNKLKI